MTHETNTKQSSLPDLEKSEKYFCKQLLLELLELSPNYYIINVFAF